MKKITAIFFAIAISLSAFAQEHSPQKTIASFPWIEDFEGTTFPPQGWSILNVAGERSWERVDEPLQFGTNGIATHTSATGLQHTALVTPRIAVPAFGNPTLDFRCRTQFFGFYQFLGIYVSRAGNTNWTAFVQIWELPAENRNNNWQRTEISLNDFLGEEIYIAFVYRNTGTGPQWRIDDIRIAHEESFIDVEAIEITPKSGEHARFSANEPVSVRLRNNGGPDATNFELRLYHNNNLAATETFANTIADSEEAIYTFIATLDLSAVTTHTIRVIANIAGDQNRANDTATSTVVHLGCAIISTFPFEEGFENNGNNLPSCWTQIHVSRNRNWIVASNETNVSPARPATAFEGTHRAIFYSPAKGAVTKLVTPPMDITVLNNPVLTFYHIQQRYVNDQDSLKIYYRTSASAEWVLLEKFTTTIDEWTKRVIPLPNPSTQYYIAFEGHGEWGRSVQLDQISVSNHPAVDIAVTAITPEGTHLDLSNQQTITATVRNLGRAPVNEFYLTLLVNGTYIATERVYMDVPVPVLQGLGEVVWPFNNRVDFSRSGYYEITVIANFAPDEVPENDTLRAVVRNLVCDALTFPYSEGFEGENFPPYCWTMVGDWRRLTHGANSGIGRASFAWWFEGNSGWLISPKFSIPTEGDFALEFWSHVYERRFFTTSEVRVSTTGNSANLQTFNHVLLALGSSETTPESQWIRFQLSLQEFAGQDIYIAFRYQNQGGQSGHMWSIDDFRVFNLQACDDTIVPPPVSIQIVAGETLYVYPNPVSDVLYIITEQTIQKIVVLDMSGRIVKTQRGNYRTIHVQALPAGHYIVQIHTATAIIPIRIVKQ